MSLIATQSPASHPGFTRNIDPQSARRQLHVSLGVVAILGLAICGSAYAIKPVDGFDAASQRSIQSAEAATARHDVAASVRMMVPDRS